MTARNAAAMHGQTNGKPRQDGPVAVAYRTKHGSMLLGTIEDALSRPPLVDAKGKVNLVFTSPPFPLTRKKRYGNKTGEEYLKWMESLAPRLADLLAEDGSLVVEIGNAWMPGQPEMSTLPLQTLLKILESAKLHLCQQFICHNPARLPGPAEWVNIERIRVKDSYTHVWWMSRTLRPKADNRRVLVPYSPEMLRLLKSKNYNAGTRPSGHYIGDKTFLTNNGGAIPSSVLTYSNTAYHQEYVDHCRKIDVEPHPARMAAGLAEFFIMFLTDPGDLVVEPFAGSNTTGAVAERLKRRWIAVELKEEYVAGSIGRFPAEAIKD